MLWKEYLATLTDNEFKAIFAYMKGLLLIGKPRQVRMEFKPPASS